jgi:hypothetical protein
VVKKGNIPAILKDSISTASLGGVCLLSDYTSGYKKKASVSRLNIRFRRVIGKQKERKKGHAKRFLKPPPCSDQHGCCPFCSFRPQWYSNPTTKEKKNASVMHVNRRIK